MAAIHHCEMLYIPGKTRGLEAALPWLGDAAAALGLVAFIASCFVLMDALQGLFA
jgi:hypothetical protein